MPLCLTEIHEPQRSARRKQRRDSAIYAEIHEYPLTDYREGEAAITMMMMRRHSHRDPHYAFGQPMEQVLQQYQGYKSCSIHITSHLLHDPHLCAASRKEQDTNSRCTPMKLRKTSRKQNDHDHNPQKEGAPAFACTRLYG